MGRPAKKSHHRVKKDAFSGPKYLIAAAKKAAGVERGEDFSPWVVAAIREKLIRDGKAELIEQMRTELENGDLQTITPQSASRQDAPSSSRKSQSS